MVKKYGQILILYRTRSLMVRKYVRHILILPYQIIDGEEIEGDTDVGNLRGTN